MSADDAKTIPPVEEPEYVGAHSALLNERCQHYPNIEGSSLGRCAQDATHTVVTVDGNDIHEVAMCDECGEPDDVDAHDREWSGDVRGSFR